MYEADACSFLEQITVEGILESVLQCVTKRIIPLGCSTAVLSFSIDIIVAFISRSYLGQLFISHHIHNSYPSERQGYIVGIYDHPS